MKLKPQSTAGSLVELVLIVATALALALGIQAFLVKPYRIPSASMEPTLDVGERVLVNRVGNRFSKPEVNDILVFHPPVGAETPRCGIRQVRDEPCRSPTPQKSEVNFIKRVVGVPGDRIAILDGHVVRNGKRVVEPFIRECGTDPSCNFPRAITIPPGHYFMMGDNRGESDDSRFWGPVPEDWIIGGAFATYWPPKKLGLL